MKKSSFNNIKADAADDIITRMCIVAKVQNRNQLSKVLNIAPNVIAGWISRNNVPYKWIHFIADKFDSSFDFIKKGYTLDADEIAKEAELDKSEEPIKYSYIKKPIKHVYIAMPRAYDADDTEPKTPNNAIINSAIAIGENNSAITQINQNDITNTPKFKEFLELFKAYGNDAALDGFIKKLEALKEILEN